MRKVCVLIAALAITASGAIAAQSSAVVWGPEYALFVQGATHRSGSAPAAEDLSPMAYARARLFAQARACFERPAAEELVRFFWGLSVDALSSPSPSTERYVLMRVWLRSTCSLAVNSIYSD